MAGGGGVNKKQDFNSRGHCLFPVFFVCPFSMTTIIPWPLALITGIRKLTQPLWSHKPSHIEPQQQRHVMCLWSKQDLMSLLPFSDFHSIGYLLADRTALLCPSLYASLSPPTTRPLSPSLIQPWQSLQVFYFYHIWLPHFTSFWICLSLPHEVECAYLPFSQLELTKWILWCESK